MARAIFLPLLMISALCIISLATTAHAHKHKQHSHSEVFKVEGDVYCDPCRVQFQTLLSNKLAGAEIRLECRNIETKELSFTANATTDGEGHYVVDVVGDHEDDTCEVKAISSPDMACSVPMDDMTVSRVECTIHGGLHTHVRYANPVGFITNQVSPQCISLLKELFLDQDNINHN